MYRQGDLLIVRASQPVPRTQNARPIADGIIERGEATGHAHRLVDGEAWQDRGDTFIRSSGLAALSHDEHETIILPEGEYRVVRQREFTAEGDRVVRD